MNSNAIPTFLPIEAMNPRVLASNLFTQGMTMPKGQKLPERHVFDYELEFFVESDGAMWIDGELYPITKGDVVFRRPGQITQAIMPYQCYLICFDMTGTSEKSPENYDFCSERNKIFQCNYANPILEIIPNVFHPAVDGRYLGLFNEVLKETINPTESSSLLLKAYILQILNLLYRDLKDPLINGLVPNSPYGSAIKRAVDYVRNNLETPLSLELLAHQADLSPNYFHKVFHETMGLTPNEFIIRLRLEHAKELLARTTMQVYKVAIECGIENVPYFSYCFKKHHGISPKEFRRRFSLI
ncbi:MAG TPA: AraC family transcriptional regulator [Bacillota bacterium]|nr:AraC family transcriptional regulator [Bacillota bacterium]